MIARTGAYMLVTDKYQHTWTEGKNYKVRDNGDRIIVESDAGKETLAKADCDQELFKAVFGMRW